MALLPRQPARPRDDGLMPGSEMAAGDVIAEAELFTYRFILAISPCHCTATTIGRRRHYFFLAGVELGFSQLGSKVTSKQTPRKSRSTASAQAPLP